MGAEVGRSKESSSFWVSTLQSQLDPQQGIGAERCIIMGMQEEGARTTDACAAGARTINVPTSTIKERLMILNIFILYHTNNEIRGSNEGGIFEPVTSEGFREIL